MAAGLLLKLALNGNWNVIVLLMVRDSANL
jgi:hypothetical protein